jgi:hypothetical protein
MVFLPEDWVVLRINKQPDITLKELIDELSLPVCVSA